MREFLYFSKKGIMRGDYIDNNELTARIIRFREQEVIHARLMMMMFSPSMISENYRNFEEFEEDYKDCNRRCDQCRADLAGDFYLLASNILKYTIKSYGKPCFLDEEDQIQEGVMICFEKLPKFNPQFGKAFNYLTTCVIHHFQQLYRTNKNYHDLKIKFRDYMANKEKLPSRRVKDGRRPTDREPVDFN